MLGSNWFVPTLDVGELEKRIRELKTVQFWLDQNSKTVSTTLQMLEVQKMTLAALQSLQPQASGTAHASSSAQAQTPSTTHDAAAPAGSGPATAASAPSPGLADGMAQISAHMLQNSWQQLQQQFMSVLTAVSTPAAPGPGPQAEATVLANQAETEAATPQTAPDEAVGAAKNPQSSAPKNTTRAKSNLEQN